MDIESRLCIVSEPSSAQRVIEILQIDKEKLKEYTKKLTIWDFPEISLTELSAPAKQQKGDLTLRYCNCMTTKTGKNLVIFF